MWPVSHCLAAAWPSVTSKWQFRSWACELKTKTWKRAIGRNDPLCASPTGVPRLHQTRVVLRVREPDRQHFCFSSKWIHLKPLKIGATACAWRALRPSSDSAHRGVLQQHHVGPLLFGNHAVAHPEGWNVRRAASQPLVNPPSVMKGRVFCVQISWLLQITMGTSPTETLSVAGNIFVGQVLWHPPESGVAQKHQVFTLFNPLFFPSSDWGSTTDSPVLEGHDQIWDSRCDDRRFCHHCGQRHGGLHLIWGEMKLMLKSV